MRLLDLGCRHRRDGACAGPCLPSATLIGVDGDPDVLERAQAKARAEGIELELHEALAGLPFRTRNLQCVVSTLMFHIWRPR